MKNNSALFIIVSIAIILMGFTTSSLSAFVVALIVLMIGLFTSSIISKNSVERNNLINVVLCFWGLFIVLALLKYTSVSLNMSDWAVDTNDHYKFYSASESAKSYHSIKDIFSDIITDNIYYENGGHYFYVALLSYLGYTYFDGNSIILQYIGTGFFAIMEVILLFKILTSIVDTTKARKYTLLFAILSPLLLFSISITRDTSIAAFYSLLIYLTFCKKYNVIIFLLQILIAFILTYFRWQHGLFASIFILASLILANQKSRWLYVFIVMGILVAAGSAFLDVAVTSLTETNEYYTNYTNSELESFTSGIGRYVYMLPSPIKEVTQILVSQMQFPPWLQITNSKNICDVIIGIVNMSGRFFWFSVFCLSIYCMIKQKFKSVPTKFTIAISIFFLMIIANLASLEARRIICVYPLLYMYYVYAKEYLIHPRAFRNFNKKYASVYGGLCLVYLILSVFV